MSDALAGLSEQEQFACIVAERVLGAVAEPWDVDGRQGAVDAMLRLPDSRRAAFEVVTLGTNEALQIDSILGKDGFSWPSPGNWWWTVQVGSPRDVPRLRAVYGHIARLCEAANARRPEDLWRRRSSVDPEIAWLVEESSSDMLGHPDVPAREGEKVRDTMVVPEGRGGGVDRALASLRPALADAFAERPFPRHFAKLSRAEGHEKHLFVPVHRDALPFPVMYGLLDGDTVPPEPPPLPPEVTHLWLAPALSRRVLLWTPSGWEQHHPYDN